MCQTCLSRLFIGIIITDCLKHLCICFATRIDIRLGPVTLLLSRGKYTGGSGHVTLFGGRELIYV